MTATGPGLKRRLGFWLLTLYGVGVMVGAGIYVLVGAVAGEAGTWAPIAFLLAAVIALPTALAYAELSGRIPEAAGEAAYIRSATGRVWAAAAIGLAIEATGVVSAAAVLQGGVGYLRALVPLNETLLVVSIATALGFAAVLGVLESLLLAAVLTLTEVAGLGIVAGAGMTGPAVVQPAEVATFSPIGIGAAGILAFFAFLGFEDMVNMVEETRDPSRVMPRAILSALVITTLLYALVSWAAVRTVPVADLAASRQPLVMVFERATGQGAGFLAVIAVAAALNGVLAQIVMSARVLYGLGRFVPALGVFHHAHPRFRTPVLGTVVVTLATIWLALTAPLVTLAEVSALLLLSVFCAINLALLQLRRMGTVPEGAFSAPGWVPATGAALSGLALIWGVTT
ncbi:amino acid permease [Limibaculum sp. M0105]|uniref:Amino acid permease n=1 Tax=Thermohalobaculum xanthum TaxID=2753746 RepID=A0A8J7M8Z1_9RHOB|nr:APC family permease [Thermohalobaculum xanthum]MBK0399669.1 amino acid permease [Thermohalobaculum xanthum]